MGPESSDASSDRAVYDELVQRRGLALIDLVDRQLPQEFRIPSIRDGWPAIGVGLLARMATTLRSMLDLQKSGLEADGSILGRSLYEHAVYFAWIAADPETRIVEWRRADITQRLKLDDDMRRHGDTAYTRENRDKAEADLRLVGGPLRLRTEQLAIAADQHWTGKIPGLRGQDRLHSFSGLYASLFRDYSSTAHPSELGLARVWEGSPGQVRIRLEQPDWTRLGPYGMANILFALTLFVASQSIGWPNQDEIHRIYEGIPG
jgi:uncharacterized protein DUF5677